MIPLEEKSHMTAASTASNKSPCIMTTPIAKIANSWKEETEFKIPLAKKIRKTISKPIKKTEYKASRNSKIKSKDTSDDENDLQKYYMNFDFYFKRTCFRTMTLFYKV